MAFADEVAEVRTKRVQCRICLYLNNVEDRSDIEKVLADPGWSDSVIAKALARRGVKLDRSGVQRHRQNHMPGFARGL